MENGIPIRSLSRGIAVLQAINRGGSATLTDIAKACNLPFPTVSRLVQSLLHEGLIEREQGRRRYRPTALVQTLAHGFQGDARLVKATRPHIVELTRMVGWPITLSTHVGHSMVIRDSTHALSALTFNEYFPGYASPLLDTAAGLIYIASLDEAERGTLIASMKVLENPEWDHAIALAEDAGFIGQLRDQGYATRSFNRFTRNPGKTSSLAATIFDDERPIGAVSLAFFASAMKMEDAVERFSELIRTCASAVSAELTATSRMAEWPALPGASTREEDAAG
ncbi:IclR family transcriptional regulator [Novosphingobium barchaimii LL02]|uniref:IclR family transcriptional regulator n=1 Tax=Novosphingobium barchaimii LL02 TaxID=1114963 RepID=A0A0J7XXN3_9SPHN|nr:helix-turn-helix domain-containing protein [Novosphingobium barchaimii]KMS56436.1 IclR family transcriptional regulator [Novosphingobium barchaimii LL02]